MSRTGKVLCIIVMIVATFGTPWPRFGSNQWLWGYFDIALHESTHLDSAEFVAALITKDEATVDDEAVTIENDDYSGVFVIDINDVLPRHSWSMDHDLLTNSIIIKGLTLEEAFKHLFYWAGDNSDPNEYEMGVRIILDEPEKEKL